MEIARLIKQLFSLDKPDLQVISRDIKEMTRLKRQQRETFGCQKGQVDYLLMNIFDYERQGLKRGGYFVDLACADGVELSNTYFLEKYLEWTGLLFEPNPDFHDSIASNRTSPLVAECVTDGAEPEVEFRIDNGMLGGIVGEGFDNSAENRAEELQSARIIRVPTVTLVDALDRHGAPRLIDYLSLDVEGAEELILREFDFSRYKFRFMTIERPSLALDLLLDRHGYVQLAHSRFDVFYTHRDFLDQVNFEPRSHFIATPAKDW